MLASCKPQYVTPLFNCGCEKKGGLGGVLKIVVALLRVMCSWLATAVYFICKSISKITPF